MLSDYENVLAMEALKKEINDLNSQIYKKSLHIHQLQRVCKHKIIIYNGDDKLKDLKQKFYVDSFYCPNCGRQSLQIVLNNNGESTVLDASGFKGFNSNINLNTVLNIYIQTLKEFFEEPSSKELPTMKMIAEKIKYSHGIEYYKADALNW